MIRFELNDVNVPVQVNFQSSNSCRGSVGTDTVTFHRKISCGIDSGKLYTFVSDLMYGDLMNGVNGVPGISKFLFLVYFIYIFLQDTRFQDKCSAGEFDQGNYWYFQPNSEATLFLSLFNMETTFGAKIFIFCVTSAIRFNRCREQSGHSYSALLVHFAAKRF